MKFVSVSVGCNHPLSVEPEHCIALSQILRPCSLCLLPTSIMKSEVDVINVDSAFAHAAGFIECFPWVIILDKEMWSRLLTMQMIDCESIVDLLELRTTRRRYVALISRGLVMDSGCLHLKVQGVCPRCARPIDWSVNGVKWKTGGIRGDRDGDWLMPIDDWNRLKHEVPALSTHSRYSIYHGIL